MKIIFRNRGKSKIVFNFLKSQTEYVLWKKGLAEILVRPFHSVRNVFVDSY